MHLQLLTTTPALSVFHDADNDWLYLDWQGDLNLKLVQEGCMAIMQCFRQKSYVRVLNDNTSVTRLSPEVASWLATKCLPCMQSSAVEYIAWTCSPNIDTQSWINTALHQLDGPIVAMFDDVESAYAWLREVKFRSPRLLAAQRLSTVETQRKLQTQLAATLNWSKQQTPLLSVAVK